MMCLSRTPRSLPSSWQSLLLSFAFLFLLSVPAFSLSGTYTVGSGGNYTSIDAAITALNGGGVTGPVTFSILNGTYSPSGSYWSLGFVSGMSATNTVTFKPAAGATVLLSTSNGYPMFYMSNASYYNFDGSNTSGGSTKNMTLRNTGRGSVFLLQNNSNYNQFRNMYWIGAVQTYYTNRYIGLYTQGYQYYEQYTGVSFYNYTYSGSYNTIANNFIGDTTGTYRSDLGVMIDGYYNPGYYAQFNKVDSNRFTIGNMDNYSQYYNSTSIYFGNYTANSRATFNTFGSTTTFPSGTPYYCYVYGVYDNQYGYNYYCPGLTSNDTIAYNKFLQIVMPQPYYYVYYYGIYAFPQMQEYYSPAANFNYAIHNNMMTINGDYTSYYGYQSYTYGIDIYQYMYSPYGYGGSCTVNVDHNTIHIAGTGSSTPYNYNFGLYHQYMYLYSSGTQATLTLNNRNNIYSTTRVIPGVYYGSLMQMYVYPVTGATITSNYNLVYQPTNSLGSLVYNAYTGGYYATLASWQSNSGKDLQSATNPSALPYVSVANGDLHIPASCNAIFRGEGMALPGLGYSKDIDGDARYALAPDVGADEGAFNGGGILVTAPNGGEQITVSSPTTVSFTTTRPMNVSIQLSLDAGATWTNYGSVNPTNIGLNNFTFNTPNTTTNQALVRVMTNVTPYNSVCEGDTSNALFQLVRPELTIISPNGTNTLYGGDVSSCAAIPSAGIKWTSKFIPPGVPVHLDYSIDNGTTWINIQSNVASPNNVTNCINWTIPFILGGTTNALVRVRYGAAALPMVAGTINDVSDAVFTILQTPSVKVLAPNGPADQVFVNERFNITWQSISTNEVKLEYSVDLGSTWTLVMDHVPAYLGSFSWLVPNFTSSQLCSLLVRVTNMERQQYFDLSDAAACGVASSLTVFSPNGGEQYELSDLVTAQWSYQNATIMRLDFTNDNGVNWTTIKTVNLGTRGTGTYSWTFTPPAIPTDRALIRVVNVERPTVMDMSNSTWSILPGKSISVFSPAGGMDFVRNTQTQIRWKAVRIAKVNIRYSLDGGATWTTLATNVDAPTGSYLWTLPNTLTNQAKVRIEEVGGTAYAETDLFHIVATTTNGDPMVTVTSPNGGELYTTGDVVPITWTSSGVQNVSIFYSMDAGISWTVITGSVLATSGTYSWTPTVPGTLYRVRVAGSQAQDISDANFTVGAKLNPAVTVLYPNGGESFFSDSAVVVRWTEKDLVPNSPVLVEFSSDNMASWNSIGSSLAGTDSIQWNVPKNVDSKNCFVRVTAGAVSDMSDGAFTIKPKPLLPIRVLIPNGGENWFDLKPYDITWSAPADVTGVHIEYSVDGGSSWLDVVANAPSIPGNQKYTWMVPQLTQTMQSSLVRVSDVTIASRNDISDAVFTLTHRLTGVSTDAVTGSDKLRLVGTFPNPFAEKTEVRWVQDVAGAASIRLFTQTGTTVLEQKLGAKAAGSNSFELKSGTLPSGVYMYEIQVGGFVARSTVTVVR